MKAHFEMMAAYNAWANEMLYGAVSELGDADYRADLGAFFSSIHGTLNHVVVADLLWLARFRRQPRPPFSLDAIPHDDREELWAARRVLDADTIRYIGGLGEADLAGGLTYSMVARDEIVTQPLIQALAHFFNHQTHHRGQVHALLTRLTGASPPLDLVYFQREVA